MLDVRYDHQTAIPSGGTFEKIPHSGMFSEKMHTCYLFISGFSVLPVGNLRSIQIVGDYGQVFRKRHTLTRMPTPYITLFGIPVSFATLYRDRFLLCTILLKDSFEHCATLQTSEISGTNADYSKCRNIL